MVGLLAHTAGIVYRGTRIELNLERSDKHMLGKFEIVLGRGAISYPNMENAIFHPATFVVGVGLGVGNKLIESLGLGSGILLQDIFQRHDDVGI